MKRHNHQSVVALLVGLVATVLLSGSCARQDDVGQVLPTVAPEIRDLLRSGNHSRLVEYANREGMPPLLDLCGLMDQAYDCTSPAAFQQSDRALRGPQEQVRSVLASEFGLGYLLERFQWIDALPFEERFELRREMAATYAGSLHTVDLTEAIARLERALATFSDRRFLPGEDLAHRALAATYLRMGDPEEHEAHLRAALRIERALGDVRMVCQNLGVLGSLCEDRGDIDSMRVCWDEGIAIAKQYRLPDHAPRLHNFYARYYRRQGRTALAHEMLRESIELCRKYNGGYIEFRFIMELAEFYESLGYWDLAERLLDRATLRRAGIVSDQMRDWATFSYETLRGRILMNKGMPQKADRVFAEVVPVVERSGSPANLAATLYDWANGWLANQNPRRALEIISRALVVPADNPERAWMLAARAAFAAGDTSETARYLDRFESIATRDDRKNRREWTEDDCLRTRLSMAEGDSTAAAERLETAVDRVERYFARTDPSPDGYLMADEFSGVRELLHERYRDDPRLGYAVALWWLGLYSRLGKGVAHRPQGSGSFEQRLTRIGNGGAQSFPNADTRHLVFAPVGDEIWRWTVAEGEVNRAVVPVDLDSIRVLTTRSLGRLAAIHENKALSLDQQRTLATLARLLLPTDYFDERTAPRTLVISSCGFLTNIPFEVLNCATHQDAYEPLLTKTNVVYMRPTASTTARAPGSSDVILLCGTPSREVSRRFPFHERLLAAPREAEVASRMMPGAIVLAGDNATKPKLLAAWARAGTLYIVGHVLRDPEAPYLVLLPLNGERAGDGIEESCLEIRDVTEADLTGCNLVVLSGCSTGLQITGRNAASVSLAQAFLDAGARIVVHTFWDVEDNSASEIMSEFLTERSSGKTAVEALCGARRRAMAEYGANHPSYWASYGVTIRSVEGLEH